jgi:hypothetical protein
MKAAMSTLDALLHDDLLFNGPTGETATKAMDLNYRSGGVRLSVVEPSDYTPSAIDDDVIVADRVLRGRIHGAARGGSISLPAGLEALRRSVARDREAQPSPRRAEARTLKATSAPGASGWRNQAASL